MEFVIFYFSGTGNTELISRELKKCLEAENHKVEVLSIENIEKIAEMNFDNKVIGFGYPIYKFTFPDIFQKLFPLFNILGNNNRYFQFCTYARFTADTFYDFSRKLKPGKFNLIAEQSFKSPSNGISARQPIDDYEYQTVMFFEDDIANKVWEFAKTIINNAQSGVKVRQKRPGLIAPVRLRIVKDIEITKYPKLQIDKEKCAACGLCAKKCPDSNLKMKDNSVHVIDDKDCLHCLRCMHHCPSNAIIFGALTRGENRYTLKNRNEFFAKSAGGYKEKYWENFESTRNKWRKNTIKYWWKHKNKPEVD